MTKSEYNSKEKAILFLSDGRFHIESTMIYNPMEKYFQYNPYTRKITIERYGHKEMLDMRKKSIEQAKKATKFGLIFGTLGRQGNPELLWRIVDLLEKNGKEYFILLISEINGNILDEYGIDIEIWIQLCCPRLSVDWGNNYTKPLLNGYEAFISLGAIEWKDDFYPMDNYTYSGGLWSSNYGQKPIKSSHKN